MRVETIREAMALKARLGELRRQRRRGEREGKPLSAHVRVSPVGADPEGYAPRVGDVLSFECMGERAFELALARGGTDRRRA